METEDIKQTGLKHKVMWLTSRITVLSFTSLYYDNKNRSIGRDHFAPMIASRFIKV